MKQSIISCLLAFSLASAEHEHEGYSPYFANGAPGLIDLGEHLDPKQEFKVEHPAGLIFGHGFLDGIHDSHEHKGLDSFHVDKLEYVADTNLLSFDKQLPAPEVPKAIVTAGKEYEPKYTNTPTKTYEVVEESFEPKPVPRISVATPILPAQKAQIQSLGSGSLGVTKLGSGGYALGSGSLGYVNSQSQSGFDFGKNENEAQPLTFDFTKGDSAESFSGELQGGDSEFKSGGGIADFASLFKER